MSKIHNLDEIAEYFEFQLKGHQYRFRHLTTDEIEALQKMGSDDAKSREYLYTFITPINKESPAFKKIAKTMITPHWVKFREMIRAEFGA